MSDPNIPTNSSPPPSAGNGRTFSGALRSALREPAFLIVTLVLLVAALGLNTTVKFMELHFKKEPVALARPLGSISNRLGSWVQVSEDQPLDKEIQDSLGTDKYIFRDYVDERVVGPNTVDEIRNMTDQKDRTRRIEEIRMRHPEAIVRLSVTYYTGMVDTVAHVPDRCVTADGYEPTSYETPKWPIAADLPESERPDREGDVEVRYINFEDQTGSTTLPRSVAYFFHVNGTFDSSPLGVRQKLADLFERKAYYAKIETMTTMKDSAASAKVMTDFLAAALPEITQCMPDWAKLHGHRSALQVAEK